MSTVGKDFYGANLELNNLGYSLLWASMFSPVKKVNQTRWLLRSLQMVQSYENTNGFLVLKIHHK